MCPYVIWQHPVTLSRLARIHGLCTLDTAVYSVAVTAIDYPWSTVVTIFAAKTDSVPQ